MDQTLSTVNSDIFDSQVKKGQKWVIALGFAIIVSSLMILTTFNNQIFAILIRCGTAVALMFGVRWIRYFFIITGFLSGLLNIVNGIRIFEFVGTDGNGMLIPAPSRDIIPYDCYCMIAIGIINIIIAVLLINKKEIKAFYNSIRMKKTMQYIADNQCVYNQMTNYENQNENQKESLDLSDKNKDTLVSENDTDIKL